MGNSSDLGKTLMAVGGLLFVVGALVWGGGRFLPRGRMPGDIVIERENFRFYFPLGWSLLISAGLSAIMWLIRRR